jgi:hypothetical protein
LVPELRQLPRDCAGGGIRCAGLVGKVCAFAKAAQPMSPITASRKCFIISPYRVSQRAFYCPTRVNFPNKVSAIQSAVNGRNCN